MAKAITTANVAITELVPYRRNPRRGNVDAIKESLREHGQYRPIVVRRATREVLAGNHTLEAARQLGWRHIAVTFVDCDEEQAKRIVLADNRTNDLADSGRTLGSEAGSAQGRWRNARFAMHLRNQQREIIHEAPRPVLARLKRADQGVAAASSVGTGVTVGRVVTAADMAALQADAQM